MRTLRALLPLLALLLAAPAALGQDAEAPERDEFDILDFSPSHLSYRDAESILREAQASYGEERYEEAARHYIRALRVQPGDATSLYNLACCYGLLGHAGQASDFLEVAWKAGFRDFGHIQRDPDFEKVRESDVFKRVVAALGEDAEKRRRTAGKRLSVAARVVADVRVLEPEELQPYRRYPVLIGLHGLGDNGESFAALFDRRGMKRDFIYCAVQAPYAFLPGGKVGYSWSVRDEGVSLAITMRSRRLSAQLVMDVVEALRREYPVDERNIFLMGFSQGAGMAFSIGMKHPGTFRGVIPVGGWLDPAEHTAAEVAKARKLGNFLICHSPEDRVVPFDSAEEAKIFLTEEKVPHRLYEYAGGHTLPKDLLEEIVKWMKNPTTVSAIRVKAAEEK